MIRKSSVSKKSKKSKPSGKLRKAVSVTIGIDNDIKSFNQSVLADLGDISFLPRFIRWIDLYGDKNKSEKNEESFWNHTAKVILGGIGGIAIAFGTGVMIPFGVVMNIVSSGSNTKLWLQNNPSFEKKLKRDDTFKSKVASQFVDVINTVTITTDKKGGVSGVVEKVVEQE